MIALKLVGLVLPLAVMQQDASKQTWHDESRDELKQHIAEVRDLFANAPVVYLNSETASSMLLGGLEPARQIKSLASGPDLLPDDDPRVVAFVDLPRHERIIGTTQFLPAHFLVLGAISQRPVARVALTRSHSGLPAGSGWGTGFLVADSLFLTNNHVIPSAEFCESVEVQFNYQMDARGQLGPIDTFKFDPGSLFLTDEALDFTLVRLSPAQRIVGSPGDVARRVAVEPGALWGTLSLAANFVYAEGQRVNVIQHPNGWPKQVALRDNEVVTIKAKVLLYTTDTMPGSSGSPVLDNSWTLVALHHAGGEFKDGRWLNNEGVRIDRIVQRIRTHFSEVEGGAAVLQELGL